MRKDAAGFWVCPDEGKGRDVTTLDRINASVRPFRGPSPADAPVHTYSSPTNPNPSWVPGQGYPVPRPALDTTRVQLFDARDYTPAEVYWRDEGDYANSLFKYPGEAVPDYVFLGLDNPYLQFSGSQGLGTLGLTGFQNWPAGSGIYAYMVVRFEKAGTDEYPFAWNLSGNYVARFERHPGGTIIANVRTNAGARFFGSVTAPLNADLLVEMWFDFAAAAGLVAVNGSEHGTTYASTDTGTVGAVTYAIAGSPNHATNYFHGRLYEVGAYNTYDADRQDTIRERVASRYGISL